MIAPIHRLSKKELMWLGSHKCKHNHTYLEHYNCYLTEHPEVEEKIAFVDIETNNLDADFAFTLTWAVKPRGKEVVHDRLYESDYTLHHKEKTLFNVDKRIVKSFVDEIVKYDRIVTHYGRKFDIKFMRTRAIIDGIGFPFYGTIVNDDTYYMAKNKLKLHSNRLETVVSVLVGHSDKTRFDGNIWIPAMLGDEDSLNYVADHNDIDVIELESAWEKLKEYQGVRNTSI